MPVAVLALTAGAFGIGTTEFIIMGLLLQVGADMHVSVPAAGLLISAMRSVSSPVRRSLRSRPDGCPGRRFFWA